MPRLSGQSGRDQRERVRPGLHDLWPRVLWTLSHLSHQDQWEVSNLQETSKREKMAQNLPLIESRIYLNVNSN